MSVFVLRPSPRSHRPRRPRTRLCGVVAAWAMAAASPAVAGSGVLAPAPPAPAHAAPVLEVDVRSDFSHIRVRREGNVRTLSFVRPDGSEAVESRVDMAAPDRQLFDYTKLMFMHYVHAPRPRKVALVGLGGGAMVHFLRTHAPEVEVTVVEIDPAVVEIADRYFGVEAGPRLSIVRADGARYFDDVAESYDVIYLDAFLSTSAHTDATGVPLDLKARRFHDTLQARLTPEGVAVFNVNHHPRSDDDIRRIGAAFPTIYVYRLPGQSVVVATRQERRDTRPEILARARALDSDLRADFTFESLTRHLQK